MKDPENMSGNVAEMDVTEIMIIEGGIDNTVLTSASKLIIERAKIK
jgi:hypothetical protein